MRGRNFQQDGAHEAIPDASGPGTGAHATEEGGQMHSPELSQISVIGADIVVTGNIEASVDLHIEGKVIGDVRCATLILGESSAISGRIYATRVKVSGSVDGALDAKDLAVEASARVSGDVSYERLRVANGGVVEGSLVRRAPEVNGADGRLKLVEGSQPLEGTGVE